MYYKASNAQEIKKYFENIQNEVSSYELFTVCYIKLGSKIVRILCYSQEFFAHIKKQLTYTFLEHAEHYDATLVIWQENDVQKYAQKIVKGNIPLTMRLWHEAIRTGQKRTQLFLFDDAYSKICPVLSIEGERGFIIGNDVKNSTYYYGVRDLSPEEFIKEGHIFVQFFNKIIKSEDANLVHGAVVGLENKGVLFCARGQRGKSTLTVLSMMKGFEYVSDDYLILETEKNKLYSYPVYSIITLSPRMYTELYDEMKGKFVSNNARKDKYVINIEGYHQQFKDKYPIELCIFPEIVSDKEPRMRLCTAEEKGRAIVQFIQSTVSQVQDINDQNVIKKIFAMINGKEFYKFNLCSDIQKNTEFLREFLHTWQPDPANNIKSPEIMLDITFNLANILDTKTFTIYSMNKFATNLLENLMNGVSKEEIKAELQKFETKPPHLSADFDLFAELLEKHNFIKFNNEQKPLDINEEFAKENNYILSVSEFAKDKTNELVSQNKE